MCRLGSLVSLVLVCLFVSSACGSADLGSCDMPAAVTKYYVDGVPYYAGQAVVHQSCAGSFCHAAGAVKGARKGAPHGVNFDVSPLLTSSTPHDVSVLKSGITRIRDDADELYSLVDDGEMPPGAAGERPTLTWKNADGSAAMLPAVDTKAGKDMLRNWLACDAPLIAYTTGAPAQDQKLGDVFDKIETKVDPNFPSIFASVLSGTCASCHNTGAGNPFAGQQALDFATEDAAYAALFGKDPFSGGKCDKHGKLVVAGDCEGSLLYQKLLPVADEPADFCGDAMPLGGAPISANALKAVCDWITAGALRN